MCVKTKPGDMPYFGEALGCAALLTTLLCDGSGWCDVEEGCMHTFGTAALPVTGNNIKVCLG